MRAHRLHTVQAVCANRCATLRSARTLYAMDARTTASIARLLTGLLFGLLFVGSTMLGGYQHTDTAYDNSTPYCGSHGTQPGSCG